MAQRVKSKKPAAASGEPARRASKAAPRSVVAVAPPAKAAPGAKSAAAPKSPPSSKSPPSPGPKPAPAIAKAAAKAKQAPSEGVQSRLAELEAEIAKLRAELTDAGNEIERLRQRQELVVNRIDWVIDSLHNLIEGEG